MAMFLVTLRRSGPQYDPARPLEAQPGFEAHAAYMDALVEAGSMVFGGPLADEERVVYAFEAESEAALRSALARDPWNESHLVVESVEPWTVRLDGTRRA